MKLHSQLSYSCHTTKCIPRETHFLCMPQNLFWKIPDSLCLGIYRLKTKKRQREISSLTSSCLPRTLTNFSMIVQKVKALNLKLCRTLIHTYLLNKQEKSPDKTKNQNAKSRACLKAVFLKNPFVPLFFTHR